MLVNTYSDINHFTLLLSTGYFNFAGLPIHRGPTARFTHLSRTHSLVGHRMIEVGFALLPLQAHLKRINKKTPHKNVPLLKMSQTR